ncbi:MAG: ribonuclease R [Clostridia bacterium]
MENEIKNIKKIFEEEINQSLTVNEIAEVLKVSEKSELEKVLNLLVSEGYLVLDESKKYISAKKANMYKCRYEAKSKGFGFALYVSDVAENSFDMFVSKENSLSAMNGDTVLAKIIKIKTDSNKAEGRVVKILERANKTIVGTLQKGQSHGFVIADSKRIYEDIFVPKKNLGVAKDRDKVVVEIVKWPEGAKKAEGKIIEVLGQKDDPNMDIYSLLRAYNVPEEFPEEVIEEASKISQVVEQFEYAKRRDLRNERIVTIDGEDAKDLDDAVICKKISEDKYMLGVHIADVSNYVKEGSNLDSEAIKRGTSTYVPAKVIPMLPKVLSNGICSLNEGEDRCTLSIEMYIDKEGNILESEIFKAIINVKHRMTYTDVYKIIENKDEEVVEKYKDYKEDFQIMKEVSDALNIKRQKEGAINFDLPETKVIVDPLGNVTGIEPYNITIANKIIESFMLAANMAVAERMSSIEAPFIYRIHELPDEEKLAKLNSALNLFGKKIKGLKEVNSKELQRILDETTDEKEKNIICTLMLRSLKIAKYNHENLGHFGLSAKYYCHFTSPIRRYPDLFIHRVISKYLENNFTLSDKDSEDLYSKSVVYSMTSSECEKKSTEVEREADDMYKAKYMKDKIGQIFEGVISSVTSFGCFVKLDNTVEGLISMMSLNDDYYEFLEERYMLVGRKTGRQFKLGDRIKIRVAYVNVDARQIDFQAVIEGQKNKPIKKPVQRFNQNENRNRNESRNRNVNESRNKNQNRNQNRNRNQRRAK